MTDVIETGGELDCATVDEFLDKLSPRHLYWKENPQGWIFRGQDGDWPLLPKAFRRNVYRDFGVAFDETNPTGDSYAEAQRKLLTDFRKRLDASGLTIPVAAPDLYLKGTYVAPYGTPQTEAYPQLALAQHLGLPTPFLDWTTKSMVAAYFAAPKESNKQPRMVVWALRRDFIESGYQDEPPYSTTFDNFNVDGHWIKTETAPRDSNPNLHAQSGLFTVVRGSDPHLWPIDTVVKRIVDDKPTRRDPFKGPLMRKLSLPNDKARQLLWALSHDGIDGASMFPGYDGIVRAMKEKHLCPP